MKPMLNASAWWISSTTALSLLVVFLRSVIRLAERFERLRRLDGANNWCARTANVLLVLIASTLGACSWGKNTARIEDRALRDQIIACSGLANEKTTNGLLAAYDEAEKKGKVGTELEDAVRTGLQELLGETTGAERQKLYETYVGCLGLVVTTDLEKIVRESEKRVLDQIREIPRQGENERNAKPWFTTDRLSLYGGMIVGSMPSYFDDGQFLEVEGVAPLDTLRLDAEAAYVSGPSKGFSLAVMYRIAPGLTASASYGITFYRLSREFERGLALIDPGATASLRSIQFAGDLELMQPVTVGHLLLSVGVTHSRLSTAVELLGGRIEVTDPRTLLRIGAGIGFDIRRDLRFRTVGSALVGSNNAEAIGAGIGLSYSFGSMQ